MRSRVFIVVPPHAGRFPARGSIHSYQSMSTPGLAPSVHARCPGRMTRKSPARRAPRCRRSSGSGRVPGPACSVRSRAARGVARPGLEVLIPAPAGASSDRQTIPLVADLHGHRTTVDELHHRLWMFEALPEDPCAYLPGGPTAVGGQGACRFYPSPEPGADRGLCGCACVPLRTIGDSRAWRPDAGRR